MRKLMFLDMESQGVVDLVKAGAYKYWADKHTEVTMLVYFFDDDPTPRRWFAGNACPPEVARHIALGRKVVAHNAEFEYLGMHNTGGDWARVKPEQMICTAAQCRANGLPGSLDRASRCLELSVRKDMSAHRLMMKLCRPVSVHPRTGEPKWHVPSEDELETMLDYCERDTLVCAQLYTSLPKLTKFQQDLYLAAFEINRRGIPIDVDFAETAVTFGEKAREETNFELTTLTNGDITSVNQVQRIKEWINQALPKDKQLDSINEATLLDLRCEDVTDPTTWDIIQLRLHGRAAAIGKYSAMVAGAQADGRLRGAFLPFGAPTTGRFSSSRVQVHNLRRDAIDVDELKARALAKDVTLTPEDFARGVRGAIKARAGHTLVAIDWAQIEARVLPWLCTCDPNAQAVLDVFAKGEDIYVAQARKMFQRQDIDKETRFLGKVATLALGYQGGWRALDAMAANNGAPPFGEERGRELVDLWRTANPWAVALWAGLEQAASAAVLEPGELMTHGRVAYLKPKDQNALRCILPSGRALVYPFPEVEYTGWNATAQVTYKKATRPPKKGEETWPRMALYGGLQAENIAQAVSFDVLAETLIKCHRLDIPIILHVHDEPVAEVPTSEVDAFTQLLRSVMTTPPDWATDLPLAVDVEVTQRFK